MKTAIAALILLAGCGGMEPTETAELPAGTVKASYQLHAMVTGAGWACDGSAGWTVAAGAMTADPDVVSGSWSCNDTLKKWPATHYYTGPISGTASGSAFQLRFAANGWNMPTMLPANLTLSGDGFAGTIATGSETAAFAAAKL